MTFTERKKGKMDEMGGSREGNVEEDLGRRNPEKSKADEGNEDEEEEKEI